MNELIHDEVLMLIVSPSEVGLKKAFLFMFWAALNAAFSSKVSFGDVFAVGFISELEGLAESRSLVLRFLIRSPETISLRSEI